MSIVRVDDSFNKGQQFGQALTNAFWLAPLFLLILPDEERRRKALPWFFGSFLLKLGLRYGEIYTTDSVAGGAIWLKPGAHISTLGAMRMGAWAMPFYYGWGGFQRSMRITNAIDQTHEKAAPMPHWYLMMLGVDPAYQGQGLGDALIQPVMGRAKSEGVPCYLETFKEANVRFYEKRGFRVCVTKTLDNGATLWGMLTET
jgi:ribosomal protein S18 acetylase RimI-like enzyme